MKTFKQLFEEIWTDNKRKWVSVDLKDLDKETLDKLWNMYETTYKPEGIDNYKEIKQLTGKYKVSWFIDFDKDPDPDAFMIYKEMPNNNFKISLLGSDMSSTGKRLIKNKLYKLLKTKGWYIEASKKMEKILKYQNLPFVDSEEKIKKLIKKKFDMLTPEDKDIEGYVEGEGYYKRRLTNTDINIVKRIYGKPNV